MADGALPTSGFGFSWILDSGKDLVTKSLSPDFVFVDYETFVNTNVRHRLAKRSIAAYVSLCAPTGLLASLYGWQKAIDVMSDESDPATCRRALDYIFSSVDRAEEEGADAIILCDDLCGEKAPIMDPRFVIEHVLPDYQRIADHVAERGLPIIYHSTGDIREYYSALASDGYSAVHIVHPGYEQTEELFEAARRAGLLPMGGIIASRTGKDDPSEIARFAAARCAEGGALICDDGSRDSIEDIEEIIGILQTAREMAAED